MLTPIIKEISFFKERDIKDKNFIDIGSCLKYEFHDKGSTVFKLGTTGNKFYIILRGVVSVQLPVPRNSIIKEDPSTKRDSVVHFTPKDMKASVE